MTHLKRAAAFVFLALVVVGAEQPQAQAASDFAFRFEFGCGEHHILDTMSGSFTQKGSQGPARTVTVPMSLSPEQMDAISNVIEDIHFFDYPENFRTLPATLNGEIMTTSPSDSYRLEVRSAGRSHAVSWDDKTKPSTKEADDLRRLFQLIERFIFAHPAAKALPNKFPCM
jgi:hypothetical protein